MEVGMGKCDRCLEEHTPDEFKMANKPKDPMSYRSYTDEPWFESPEMQTWFAGITAAHNAEPEKLCVIGDDDYCTTICLDHLGLQLKEPK